MIPFQLSPVETWKSVRKAMPKFSKVACRLMPSQGFSSLQTARRQESSLHCPPALGHPSLISESPYNPWRRVWTVPSPQTEKLRFREIAHKLGLRLRGLQRMA